MSDYNLFFSLTNTKEEYTEDYVYNFITNYLRKSGMVSFAMLYRNIFDHYKGVKLNFSSFKNFVYDNFGIKEFKKKEIKNKVSHGSCFFKYQDTGYKFTDDYLVGVTKEIIGDKKISKEVIYYRVSEEYKDIKINRVAFFDLLDSYFPHDSKDNYFNLKVKDTILSNSNKIDNYDLFQSDYKLKINELLKYKGEDLYKQLYRCLDNYGEDVNISKCLSIVMTLAIKNESISLDEAINKCVDIENNESNYLNRIKETVNNINENNFITPCKYIFRNENILLLLNEYQIFEIKDFKKANEYLLLILLSQDINDCISDLEMLSDNYINLLSAKINNAINNLNDEKSRTIILRRNGYFTSDKETLQEIADKYGVTRERIRQLEFKYNQKLKSLSNSLFEYIKKLLNYLIRNEERPFIRVEDLLNNEDLNETIYNCCLLLNNIENISYKYNEDYHIIYDSNLITKETIENDIINKYGKMIPTETFNSASNLEKEVIKNIYRESVKYKDLYTFKRYAKSELINDLISHLFPNGFHQYSDEDIDILQKEYINRVGDVEPPTQASLRGLVDRSEYFCLVDKGTYKPRKDCVTLPQYLINKIYKYIYKNLPTVDYISIYKQFEDELNQMNIDNYYYLKGIIDYTMPDDLVTKRNYITQADNVQSARETRLQYMHSFDSAFTINDLKKRFNGTKDYVFQFLCYEEAKNGLIQIDTRKYIYADKLNITEEQKNKLKDIIEECFKNVGGDILTAKKLYAKIKISYSYLIDEIKYIDGHYPTFSLIKYLFPNDYYYDRPYISKKPLDNNQITTRQIIINYLRQFDEIDYQRYKNYCLKMNLPTMYSYIQIVEELSDDYVQVNDRKLINKKLFNLSDNSIKEIDNTLKLVLDRTSIIDTSTFNGYMMFPQISYKWNKHVLAGIVRSYFSEEYDVENIMDNYISEPKDYKIRRYGEDGK